MSPTYGSPNRLPMRSTSTRCPITSVGSIDSLGIRYGLTMNAWISSARPSAITTISDELAERPALHAAPPSPRRRLSSSRHWRMRSWWPESSTSGTPQPRQSAGRV